jgi:hypothetical protein
MMATEIDDAAQFNPPSDSLVWASVASLREILFPATFFCQRPCSPASQRGRSVLHLAAMEELKLTRLMTLDNAQAKAAKAVNYTVLCPTI